MNAKLRRYLVTLSLVVLAMTPAQAFEAFVSVDDYMAAPREARMTFLAGVYDSFGTLQDAGLFSSETLATTVERIIECTSPMAIEEIETLFTARLKEDRGDWDTAAVSRFIFAFDDYCS